MNNKSKINLILICIYITPLNLYLPLKKRNEAGELKNKKYENKSHFGIF